MASRGGLSPEERLDLVFLPLMQQRRSSVDVVTGALHLALQLPEEEQRQTLAALIGLGQHFLKPAELSALLEGLMATSLGQQILERGFEQGRADTKREDVLKVLAKQFGAVPPPVSERLLQIDDVERLDALFDVALVVSSLEEFTQALG